MKTTALFVELFASGVGTFLWLSCLLGAFIQVPIPALGQESNFWVFLMPVLLTFVYMLGIVWDLMADRIFAVIWEEGIRKEEFGDDLSQYHHARRIILMGSPELTAQLEYGRHKLRICRGWCLNALMLAWAMPLCIQLKTTTDSVNGFIASALWCLISLSCGLAWRSLVKDQYKKVKRQHLWVEKWLEQHPSS